MKILHLFPRFAVGGAEKLVLDYARLMNGADFEIAVGSCVEDDGLQTEFEKLGIRVFAGSRRRMGGRLGVWRELKKFVDEWQPDIVHTHLMAGDFYGFLIQRRARRKHAFQKDGIKWVSTQHNVESHSFILRRLLWRLILPRADRVIAVAQKVNNYCVNNFGVQTEKITTILNGIDLTRWLNVSGEIFNGDKLRIATIGRVETQKGHKYLLHALARLKNINWSWDIFGDGSLAMSYKNEAQKLGIADRIVWHGVVPDVENYLTNIDLVIAPSLWEGLSLVVMEVMGAGRCIIVTGPAGDELVDAGKTGLTVPARDVHALAEAIKFLYVTPAVARERAVNAREYARTHFSIEKNLIALRNLYLALK